jgi:ABC-type sugar transport system ATPase subunit
MIAGLERPDAGAVRLDGEDVSTLPPARRGLAMVFQNGGLFPHLTVRENLAFGLRRRRVPRAERGSRIREASGIFRLGSLLGRRPGALSGGERRRVALARAFVRRARLVLLDEPLVHLDPPLREEMREAIRTLHRRSGATLLLVTHDQEEALRLGQRVAVLRAGRLEQAGPPVDVFAHPATAFVAGFVGRPPMNLFRGTLRREGAGPVFVTDAVRWPLPDAIAAAAPPAPEAAVLLGLRPDRILPLRGDASAGAILSARIDAVEPTGRETRLRLRTDDGACVALVPSAETWAEGAEVRFAADLADARLFDAESGRALTPDTGAD